MFKVFLWLISLPKILLFNNFVCRFFLCNQWENGCFIWLNPIQRAFTINRKQYLNVNCQILIMWIDGLLACYLPFVLFKRRVEEFVGIGIKGYKEKRKCYSSLEYQCVTTLPCFIKISSVRLLGSLNRSLLHLIHQLQQRC